jgi:hypothetical protein
MAQRIGQQLVIVRGESRSVLVVCATHDEIREVTAAIRDERQQAGELGQAVTVERYVPLHYTMAQKRARWCQSTPT